MDRDDVQRYLQWLSDFVHSRSVNRIGAGLCFFVAFILFLASSSGTDVKVISGAVLVMVGIILLLREYVVKKNTNNF